MPCSKLRRTTNMNSIVYNKYPIMIAPAGNPPLALLSSTPPPPLNQSTPLGMPVKMCIRRTNWINYENHENWVNSFWLNNCLAFVGHRTAAACFFFNFFYFCIAMSCIPSPLPPHSGEHCTGYVPHATCCMPHAITMR